MKKHHLLKNLLFVGVFFSALSLHAEGVKIEAFDFAPENVVEFEDDFELEMLRLSGSYCPSLSEMAKNAKWSLVNPTGKKPDFIVADKSRRYLHLLVDGQIIRTYRVALGKQPVGHKRKEGDNKTPEGLYRIGYKNPNSNFHLSLQVSYPNDADKAWAKKNGVNPGGGIMVHGLPNNPLTKKLVGHPSRNWTAGCVAVTDTEIEQIYRLVQVGTPIELCK